jgi:UDP-glucose 4-epimerase
VPSAILRPFAVYGPGEAPERLLPSLLAALRDGRPLDLTPGDQRRDWLHVDDVVAAYLRAAQLDAHALNGVIWNVCSGTPVSVRQFGETLAGLLGAPRELLRWGRLAYRPEEPMWIVGSNHRLCTAAGWRPQYSLAEGLNRCRIADPCGLSTCPALIPPATAAA